MIVKEGKKRKEKKKGGRTDLIEEKQGSKERKINKTGEKRKEIINLKLNYYETNFGGTSGRGTMRILIEDNYRPVHPRVSLGENRTLRTLHHGSAGSTSKLEVTDNMKAIIGSIITYL
jgi:hypothetical protein